MKCLAPKVHCCEFWSCCFVNLIIKYHLFSCNSTTLIQNNTALVTMYWYTGDQTEIHVQLKLGSFGAILLNTFYHHVYVNHTEGLLS